MTMGKGKTASIIQTLIRNSRDLTEISKDFTQIAPNYTLATFHKTRPLQGATSTVVDEMCAHMLLDTEKSVPVDADHVSMCQFSDADNPAFQMTSKFIRDTLKIRQGTVETTAVQDRLVTIGAERSRGGTEQKHHQHNYTTGAGCVH